MTSPTRTNNIDHGALPEVVYRDEALLAVNKPCGMASQADPTGPGLLEHLQRMLSLPNIGLPHRLDRPVSGVLLFTLGREHLARMNELFRKHHVHKTYWAIVEGVFNGRQVLRNELRQDPRARKARVSAGEGARLEVVPLVHGERYTLVRADADGGLFHQVRAQLAAAGHPVKGDVKYGARRGEKDRSIALHARRIAFDHPARAERMEILAPAPDRPLWNTLLDAYRPEVSKEG
ncbi:MAG: RluA family pseudouridine synthase [Flavobacteriales bacterium]|nr:RluA family pseudouridine synthase [Flavobacteriales bacterium]